MIFRSTAITRVFAMTPRSGAGALVERKADKGRVSGVLTLLGVISTLTQWRVIALSYGVGVMPKNSH